MIKHESLFVELSDLEADPTDVGRQQFLDHQSHGIVPDDPDPYYLLLEDGKKAYDDEPRNMRYRYLTMCGKPPAPENAVQQVVYSMKDDWPVVYWMGWHHYRYEYSKQAREHLFKLIKDKAIESLWDE